MLINKGTDINASWTNSIATSTGNGTWKTISAANLTVSPQVTRDRNQTSKHKITLLDGTDELEWFFLSDVTNQATWTDDTAGLVKAVLDITTWIGTVTDSASEILAELIAIKNKVATESTLASLNSKDFATQTTLAAIKSKTDLLTFTADKLKTTGEDGGGSEGGGATEVTMLDVLLQTVRLESAMVELVEETKVTNKFLRKIYNPE